MTQTSQPEKYDRIRLYPAHLENASADQKKLYFNELRINHARLAKTVEEIRRLLDTGFDKSLIFLTGPSGVGKSVASEFLVNSVNKEFFELHPNDLQTMPAILLEAWGPEGCEFDWADFYEDALNTLQVPLIEDSLPPINRKIVGGYLETPMVEHQGRVTFRALRKRFRKAIKQRSPTVIAIDEGSNILTGDDSYTTKKQANTLKSIVNKANTRLLIAGAYDLFWLSVKSGQLTRRSETVHFSAYSANELEDFLTALLTLQNHIPLSKRVDLTPYAGELFKQCLGCIGILKTILYKALDLALRENSDINLAILRRSYFKGFQLAKLKSELLDGYKMVEGREFFKSQNASEKNYGSTDHVKNSNQKKSQPVQRKPGRDSLPKRD